MTTDVYDSIVSDETLAEHLSTLLARPEWHARAACRGMGTTLFVPPQGVKSSGGKNICTTCGVRPECLAFGQDGNEIGTWGGLTARERAGSGSHAA